MNKLKKFKGDYLVDEDNNLYLKKGEKAMKLSFFDSHYYSLRIFSGVPVLEIDGLRMQLVRDFKTPLDYAKQVVGKLKIKKKATCGVSIVEEDDTGSNSLLTIQGNSLESRR